MKPSYRQLQALCVANRLTIKCTLSGQVLAAELVRIGVLNRDGTVKQPPAPVPTAQVPPVPSRPSPTPEVETEETEESESGSESEPELEEIPIPTFVRYSRDYEQSYSLPLRPWRHYGLPGKVLGEGAYGRVVKYGDFAIKSTKETDTQHETQPQPDVLVEIASLKRLRHRNIVSLVDVVTTRGTDTLDIGLVTPLAISDLKTASEAATTTAEIDILVYQVLCGVAYMHSRHILHRDLKPQNILYYGPDPTGGGVKIADFGLAKPFACEPNNTWTNEVFTLWYRAPEILLSVTGMADYAEPADTWAIAVTIWELYVKRPLFAGDSEINQLFLIFRALGTPGAPGRWPEASQFDRFSPTFPKWQEDRSAINDPLPNDDLRRLINSMLVYEPRSRASAYTVLKDGYFDQVRIKANEQYPINCLSSHETRDRYALPGPLRSLQLAPSQQSIVVDWLASTCRFFKYHIKTYLLVVSLFEQVLPQINPQPGGAQVLGVATLTLAADISEYHTAPMSAYVRIGGGAYTANQLNDARRQVLEAVNYDLFFTVPYDYYNQNGIVGLMTDAQWSVAKALMSATTVSQVRFKFLPYGIYTFVAAITLRYFNKHLTSSQLTVVRENGPAFVRELERLAAGVREYFNFLLRGTQHTYDIIIQELRTV